MIRKVVLGLTVVLATATGSVATSGSAHAGPLGRIKNAVRVGVQGDVRAARDFAHGVRDGEVRQGAKRAVRDVVAGAQIGVSFLKGGGGGFVNK